mgnify:CR=1 FL=1
MWGGLLCELQHDSLLSIDIAGLMPPQAIAIEVHIEIYFYC